MGGKTVAKSVATDPLDQSCSGGAAPLCLRYPLANIQRSNKKSRPPALYRFDDFQILSVSFSFHSSPLNETKSHSSLILLRCQSLKLVVVIENPDMNRNPNLPTLTPCLSKLSSFEYTPQKS